MQVKIVSAFVIEKAGMILFYRTAIIINRKQNTILDLWAGVIEAGRERKRNPSNKNLISRYASFSGLLSALPTDQTQLEAREPGTIAAACTSASLRHRGGEGGGWTRTCERSGQVYFSPSFPWMGEIHGEVGPSLWPVH